MAENEPLDFYEESGVWHDPLSRRLRAVSTVIRKAAPSLFRLNLLAIGYWLSGIMSGCLAIIALDNERPVIGVVFGIATLALIVRSKIHDVRAALRDPDPQQ